MKINNSFSSKTKKATQILQANKLMLPHASVDLSKGNQAK
jgi:hypothetical protein